MEIIEVQLKGRSPLTVFTRPFSRMKLDNVQLSPYGNSTANYLESRQVSGYHVSCLLKALPK